MFSENSQQSFVQKSSFRDTYKASFRGFVNPTPSSQEQNKLSLVNKTMRELMGTESSVFESVLEESM